MACLCGVSEMLDCDASEPRFEPQRYLIAPRTGDPRASFFRLGRINKPLIKGGRGVVSLPQPPLGRNCGNSLELSFLLPFCYLTLWRAQADLAMPPSVGQSPPRPLIDEVLENLFPAKTLSEGLSLHKSFVPVIICAPLKLTRVLRGESEFRERNVCGPTTSAFNDIGKEADHDTTRCWLLS